MDENYLDAELFKRSFLSAIETFSLLVGLLMFEFSRFYSKDYERGRVFVDDLDRFFGALPKGFL